MLIKSTAHVSILVVSQRAMLISLLINRGIEATVVFTTSMFVERITFYTTALIKTYPLESSVWTTLYFPVAILLAERAAPRAATHPRSFVGACGMIVVVNGLPHSRRKVQNTLHVFRGSAP